jgi:WD40 repeat protein
MDGLFASCSADATICLWSHKTTSTNSVSAAADIAPLHTLLAPHLEDRKIVNDVEWSSENPSILGSATGDGRFEVWNLVNSTLEPEILLCGFVPMAVVMSDDNLVEGNAARHQTTLSGSSEDRALSFAAHFESLGAAALPPSAEEHQPDPYALTTLLFSKTRDNIVVVGDSWGAVDVLLVHGIGSSGPDAEAQLRAALFREDR